MIYIEDKPQLHKYQIINYLSASPKHLLAQPIMLSDLEAKMKNQGFAMNHSWKRYVKVND